MSQMPPAAQQPEKLTLHAADGYALAAVRYRAEGAVLLERGTGAGGSPRGLAAVPVLVADSMTGRVVAALDRGHGQLAGVRSCHLASHVDAQ